MFPKEKPSKLLPILFNFIWLVKSVIPVLYPFIVIWILVVILESYYLIWDFKHDSLSYLPFYLIIIVVTTMNFVIVLGGRIWDRNCATIKTLLTSINLENEILKSKLNQHVLNSSIQKVYVSVIIITILITFCSVLNYHYWTTQAEQKVLILPILQPIFGKVVLKMWPYILFSWLFNLAITLIAACIYFIYFIFQNQMALLILTDRVMHFRKMYNKVDQRTLKCNWNLRQNAVMKYEKDILKCLKSIAVMYLAIQRSNNQIIESNQLLHFLFICAAMPSSVMSILMIFSGYEQTILPGVMNCFNFVLIGLILMDTAEHYTHFGNVFFNAYLNLSWYNWTVKSQKMYLIGIIHFSRGFKVTLFVWIDVNRQLLQKLLRTLYPLINLFFSSKNIGS